MADLYSGVQDYQNLQNQAVSNSQSVTPPSIPTDTPVFQSASASAYLQTKSGFNDLWTNILKSQYQKLKDNGIDLNIDSNKWYSDPIKIDNKKLSNVSYGTNPDSVGTYTNPNLGNTDANIYDALFKDNNDKLTQLQKDRPDLGIQNYNQLIDTRDSQVKNIEQNALNAYNETQGNIWNKVKYFVGGMYGNLKDPINLSVNLAALPVGGIGTNLASTMFRIGSANAILNATSDLLNKSTELQTREIGGERTNEASIPKEIGESALTGFIGGALLGAVSHGISKFFPSDINNPIKADTLDKINDVQTKPGYANLPQYVKDNIDSLKETATLVSNKPEDISQKDFIQNYGNARTALENGDSFSKQYAQDNLPTSLVKSSNLDWAFNNISYSDYIKAKENVEIPMGVDLTNPAEQKLYDTNPIKYQQDLDTIKQYELGKNQAIKDHTQQNFFIPDTNVDSIKENINSLNKPDQIDQTINQIREKLKTNDIQIPTGFDESGNATEFKSASQVLANIEADRKASSLLRQCLLGGLE